MLDTQDFIAGRPRKMPGPVGHDFASDHLLDDTIGIGFRGFSGGNVATVAQDRDHVAEPEDLLHPMRNVNDGDAPLSQMDQQMEQVFAFVDRQGAGRLVHYDDSRPGADGGGDLNELLLAGR